MRNEDVSHGGAAQMRLSEGCLERKRQKGPKLEKDNDFRFKKKASYSNFEFLDPILLKNRLLVRVLLG